MNDSLRFLNDFYNVKSTLIRIFAVDNNAVSYTHLTLPTILLV